ncbi:MAG: MmcB family DNA repair protein [Geminicoccaceae bacterium]
MRATDIRAALRQYFAPPEWELAFEVRNAAGFQGNRSADAIAMNTWPSRGLTLNAIEIKVSKSDLKRELKAPDKAEGVAQFCDFFWLAVPKGLAEGEMIPDAWGILEIDQGRARIKRQATKTPSSEPPRGFWAMFLRSHGRIAHDDSASLLEQQQRKQDAEFRERVKREVERTVNQRTREFADRKREIAIVEHIVGDRLWGGDEALASAIRAVHESGVARTYHSLRHLTESLEKMAGSIHQAIADLHIPDEDTVKADVKKAKELQ